MAGNHRAGILTLKNPFHPGFEQVAQHGDDGDGSAIEPGLPGCATKNGDEDRFHDRRRRDAADRA